MKKFYWMAFAVSKFPAICFVQTVSEEHPFVVQDKEDNVTYTLISWKEITEEEYRLHTEAV